MNWKLGIIAAALLAIAGCKEPPPTYEVFHIVCKNIGTKPIDYGYVMKDEYARTRASIATGYKTVIYDGANGPVRGDHGPLEPCTVDFKGRMTLADFEHAKQKYRAAAAASTANATIQKLN